MLTVHVTCVMTNGYMWQFLETLGNCFLTVEVYRV